MRVGNTGYNKAFLGIVFAVFTQHKRDKRLFTITK